MPAAAVIPAPLVYTTSTAVKKLVVGSSAMGMGPLFECVLRSVPHLSVHLSVSFIRCAGKSDAFTLRKLECSEQAHA